MQNKWSDYMHRRMLQYQSRLHEQEYSVNEYDQNDCKFDFSKEVYNYMEKVNLRDQALQWDAWIAEDNARDKALLEKLKKDITNIEVENLKLKKLAKEAEMNSKKNMIIPMYKKNIDIDLISKIANLDKNEVEEIIKESK